MKVYICAYRQACEKTCQQTYVVARCGCGDVAASDVTPPVHVHCDARTEDQSGCFYSMLSMLAHCRARIKSGADR